MLRLGNQAGLKKASQSLPAHETELTFNSLLRPSVALVKIKNIVCNSQG